jgi:DNA-binding NarL/FixJ family response regulator
MIKVLIADDQELIRDSLRIMLQDDEFSVVATVGNGNDALEKISTKKPDVVLLDIRMPVMDGIECLKRIRESDPKLPVLMLTTFDDDEYIFNSLKFGANGYLLKSISQKELKDAVRVAFRGGSLINPDVTRKVLRLFSDMAMANYRCTDSAAVPESIQKNELKIIKFIGRGYANKEIAYELGFSEGTVRNYISSILQKLDLRDRTQIAMYAVQNGLTIENDE